LPADTMGVIIAGMLQVLFGPAVRDARPDGPVL
jgi:hypothetical protein